MASNLRRVVSYNLPDSSQQTLQTCMALWNTKGVHSTIAMNAAGFKYTNIGDTAQCDACGLQVSDWTRDMNPFTVHSELKPDCSFVQSIRLGHDFTASSSNFYLHAAMSDQERPMKRQKLEPDSPLLELDSLQKARHRTFAHWPNTHSRSRMIQAGFFNCNAGDRVICLYCNLICQQWTFSEDDPCKTHQILSSHCPFVKSMLNQCDPVVDPMIDKQSSTASSNERTETHDYSLNNTTHSQPIFDESILPRCVADRLDLPISRSLTRTFSKSVIQRCWEDQLRLKQNDFADNCDLFIACIILQKQIEIIDGKKQNIVIPSIDVKKFLEKQSIDALTSKQSLAVSKNWIGSTSDGLQSSHFNFAYMEVRRKLGALFKEDEETTIRRERSLVNWSHTSPSRRDMVDGGWIATGVDDRSKCPHCPVQYHNWKPDDIPLEIHRLLSPSCLFVLSSKPFRPNPVPIRTTHEQFTDEVIIAATSEPYAGLVQSKYEPFFEIHKRVASFNAFPTKYAANFDKLAESGFYYTNELTRVKCFYCQGTVLWPHLIPAADINARHSAFFPRCHYAQQINDRGLASAQQQAFSKLCTWCLKNERQLVAMPCRHCNLCRSCGETTRTCLMCCVSVQEFVIVYAS